MAYLVRETPKFRDAFSMRESTLLRWMKDADFELLVRFHGLDAISYDGNLAGLEFVRAIYPDAKRRLEMKPLLTGDDLVRLGLNPGRKFTEILRTIEDLALEGSLSTSEEALNYVLAHFVT
jgi:poly(A) polymerase